MKPRLLSALLLACLAATPAWSAEHTVEMKNVGPDGATMVFEPPVLQVAVGDTVRFVPTDMGHSTESVPGLKPEGSVAWKGGINEEVTVTLDKEGVYVYLCMPHTVMAMVGVLVAGEPTNLEQVKADSKALTARFALNKDRLDKYLAEVK